MFNRLDDLGNFWEIFGKLNCLIIRGLVINLNSILNFCVVTWLFSG